MEVTTDLEGGNVLDTKVVESRIYKNFNNLDKFEARSHQKLRCASNDNQRLGLRTREFLSQ